MFENARPLLNYAENSTHIFHRGQMTAPLDVEPHVPSLVVIRNMEQVARLIVIYIQDSLSTQANV